MEAAPTSDSKNRRIDRQGEKWSLTIDYAHAPRYVVVEMKGSVGMDTLDFYYTHIQKVMDTVMGVGKRFCPVIFDVTGAYPGNISLPGMWRRASEVTPRIGPFVIVNRPDPESQSLKDQFIQSITLALPHLSLATSVEEAFRKLNIQPD